MLNIIASVTPCDVVLMQTCHRGTPQDLRVSQNLTAKR